MESRDSAVHKAAGPSSASQNEDVRLLNRLVDDDDGSKADRSFLEDIARKQAEIIHGFPLASLTGAAHG